MTEQAIVPAEAGAQGSGAPLTIEAFTFGDDVSVIDGRSAWGYFEGMWRNGDWYEPPIPMLALAKSFKAAAYHQSAIMLKLNLLRRHFVPSRWMDATTHDRLVLDLLQMGNCYGEGVLNMGGRLLRYKHSPALHTRVGVDPGRFFYVRPDALGGLGHHEFRPGSICHILEPDVEQEVYGMPPWLAALQSLLLNEGATLFRRRYYLNGAHAGFVFYLSEPTLTDKDANAIREKLQAAKGVGNFKNLFIHAPAGKKDGVQIIPIAEVAAKDEFAGIKNISRDDILAAQRTPPQLLGIIPQNSAGFGDIRSANDTYFMNEITPIQGLMLQINDHAGLPVIAYREYVPMMPQGAAAAR